MSTGGKHLVLEGDAGLLGLGARLSIWGPILGVFYYTTQNIDMVKTKKKRHESPTRGK